MCLQSLRAHYFDRKHLWLQGERSDLRGGEYLLANGIVCHFPTEISLVNMTTCDRVVGNRAVGYAMHLSNRIRRRDGGDTEYEYNNVGHSSWPQVVIQYV